MDNFELTEFLFRSNARDVGAFVEAEGAGFFLLRHPLSKFVYLKDFDTLEDALEAIRAK